MTYFIAQSKTIIKQICTNEIPENKSNFMFFRIFKDNYTFLAHIFLAHDFLVNTNVH